VDWSRRTFLRALGSGAAASTLAPFLAGACGGRTAPAAVVAMAEERPVPLLREELRRQVEVLSRRLPGVTALASIERVGWVLVDPEERSLHQVVLGSLALTTADGARVHEEVTTDLSPGGMARAAWTLGERASRRASPGAAFAPAGPLDSAAQPEVDPRSLAPAQWIEPVDALYERARRTGESRIAYRAAYAVCDDCETVFVSAEQDLAQRVVRTRAGVLFLGQDTRRRALAGPERADATLRVEEAGQGGLQGLSATVLPDALLENAARRVLTLFSPTPLPPGISDADVDVILAPDVAARILRDCVAPGLCASGDAWHEGAAGRQGTPAAGALAGQRVAAEAVTLIDDPRLPGAYGSYFFDDEGMTGAAVALIEAGVVRGPLTDRRSAQALGVRRTASARRAHAVARVAPAPSNLVLVPGRMTGDELIAGVDQGYLLDGCQWARVHLRSWRFTARAARAYEIRRGKRTGVVHADVDVSGDVPGLLAAVRGVSDAGLPFCYGGGGTLATTASSPFVWTRARIAGG
jgi:predicted Zn-dependent protease